MLIFKCLAGDRFCLQKYIDLRSLRSLMALTTLKTLTGTAFFSHLSNNRTYNTKKLRKAAA